MIKIYCLFAFFTSLRAEKIMNHIKHFIKFVNTAIFLDICKLKSNINTKNNRVHT